MASQTNHFGFTCVGGNLTPQQLQEYQHDVLENQTLASLRATLSLLSGKTRLPILYLLTKQEFCVCDLAEVLKTTVSAVSHQLKILKNHDVVTTRKQAQTIFYSLTDTGKKLIEPHL